MRIRAWVIGLTMAAAAALQASAAENFIVRGHPYAPGDDRLPPLGSEKDNLNLNTDLIEADIYVKQRQQKQFESDMQRFINDPVLNGPDSTRLEY
jgi:hypothetical protein